MYRLVVMTRHRRRPDSVGFVVVMTPDTDSEESFMSNSSLKRVAWRAREWKSVWMLAAVEIDLL